MSDDRVKLTVEQACGLLEGEEIHTFRSTPMCLIGADWDRSTLVDAITKAGGAEVGGAMCRAMGHGLVVWDGDEPLFVAVDDARLAALESVPDALLREAGR